VLCTKVQRHPGARRRRFSSWAVDIFRSRIWF
jgi:hypothetical protein